MNQLGYRWVVVGAGPAGIAAVGRLLDQGISPADLLWIDPAFQVGDLGRYWQQVSSNTTVQRFLDFLAASPAFGYERGATDPGFALNQLPATATCLLGEVVKPLQWVSQHLETIVHAVRASVNHLALSKRQWHLTTTEGAVYHATNVILATGAVPVSLNYPAKAVLALETALDRQKLARIFNKNHTYGVFGSSHSAMICVQSLVELGAKKVINFYRSPCRYAISQGDWILFDNTGLKGDTACWVRANIDGVMPANLERYLVDDGVIARHLPECDQVIYAVGFSPRQEFTIEGYSDRHHNPFNGIIGPGLFGFGIAFPGVSVDPLGYAESQVGLWKFMLYLNKVLPLWLTYSA